MEDEELRALLDEKFSKVDQRLSTIDARLDKVDARLDRVDARFDGVDARFDGVETESRQTRVLVEAIQGTIQKVAEGVDNANERLDRFREETAANFKEVKLLIGTSNAQLISRMRKLEKAS